jgi:hypothetical protein
MTNAGGAGAICARAAGKTPSKTPAIALDKTARTNIRDKMIVFTRCSASSPSDFSFASVAPHTSAQFFRQPLEIVEYNPQVAD